MVIKFDQAVTDLQNKFWMQPVDAYIWAEIKRLLQEDYPGEYDVNLGYDQHDYLHISIDFGSPEYETYFRLKYS